MLKRKILLHTRLSLPVALCCFLPDAFVGESNRLVTFPTLPAAVHYIIASRMKKITMGKVSHPAICLFFFPAPCGKTLSQVSAQVATFTTQKYPLLGGTHTSADLNGDGKVDLAGSGANVVSVMLGNGEGTFGGKTDFPVAAAPQAVAAGDFNSDGKVDLMATLNNAELSLALLIGTGTGTFNPPIYFPNTSGFDSPRPPSRRRISIATASSTWW